MHGVYNWYSLYNYIITRLSLLWCCRALGEAIFYKQQQELRTGLVGELAHFKFPLAVITLLVHFIVQLGYSGGGAW